VKWWKAGGLGAVLLAATSAGLAFVHPWGDVRAVAPGGQILEGSSVPDDLRQIFEQKCADCHSNQTHWPAYSRFAPASWLMEHDVLAARSAMNLSQWAGTNAEDRIALLTRIVAEVRSGTMPPRPYAMGHPANRLTESDKQEIAAWARIERKRIKSESQQQKERNTK
jgi:cytochrome c